MAEGNDMGMRSQRFMCSTNSGMQQLTYATLFPSPDEN